VRPLIADVLLVMQGEPAFADLRYDIRLFALDSEAPGTGEALVELLVPDSGVTAREADAFSTPTKSHLHPKLRLAIRSIEDFRAEPRCDTLRMCRFLFDQFPTEEMRADAKRRSLESASFVHGLIQPFAVEYQGIRSNSITWSRRPLHGSPCPLAPWLPKS
jgi:DNA phosphorothioation-dependent restriction protein DptH